MSDFITFEATLEPMPWGDSTYTVLRLPPNVMAALGKAKRVEGEMNRSRARLCWTIRSSMRVNHCSKGRIWSRACLSRRG